MLCMWGYKARIGRRALAKWNKDLYALKAYVSTDSICESYPWKNQGSSNWLHRLDIYVRLHKCTDPLSHSDGIFLPWRDSP